MPALEELTIDRRLLALPYRIELTPDGRIVMTSLHEPAPTWEELATTHPILPEDLHWKVETNARNQIIMSPPPNWEHQEFGVQILGLLAKLLQGGRPVYEAGIRTSDGTKVPDIVWVSNDRRALRCRSASLSMSPELCIEILSPSNTRREIEDKKRLYFEGGANEVWICDASGKLTFFGNKGLLKKSQLCPDFPAQLSPLD